MRRRSFLILLGATAAWPLAASAQSDYPSRPVRIVVPSSPGGGTDIVTRVLAQQLSRTMGQQFFVENRPGAAGIIGFEAVARAAADGYTLVTAPATLTVNPAVYKQVRYDPVKDFAPITQLAGISNVLLVHPSVPARTLAEFITLAKIRPGDLNYASAGVASSPHMSMELFKHMAGIELQHIPFKGTGPAIIEVISGRVKAIFSNMLTAKPLIDAGTLRALAVSGPKRVEALPNVPTVAEAGVPGYEVLQWYGLLAPAGTPQAIVVRIHAEVAIALQMPEVKQRLLADGAEPVGSTPAAFAMLIDAEIKKWANVAQVAKIHAE